MKVKLGLKILVALLVLANIAKAQTYMEDMIGLGMKPELAEYIAGNIVGGAVLGNNTYFKARNQANSANLDLLKADANDETIINSDAGDSIHLQQGSDANRLLNFGASSDTALTLTFGDSGTTAVQFLTVSASTSDADDDSSLVLAGGGAATSNGTRGAIITLPGEEVSGGSDITYNAGAGDTHIFQVAGTTEATISDDALTFSGASAALAYGATSGLIKLNGTTELTLTDDTLTFSGAAATISSGATTLALAVNGTAEATVSNDALTFSGASAALAFGATSGLFKLNGNTELTLTDDTLTFAGATTSTLATGATLIVNPVGDANRKVNIAAASDTAHVISFGDAGTTASQTLLISATTADADDDSTVTVAAGGANGTTRGASLVLKGDDVGGAGAGAGITYEAGTGTTGYHSFLTAGTEKWQIEADGDLVQNATNGSNLIMTKASTGIQWGLAATGDMTATGSGNYFFGLTPIMMTAGTADALGTRLALAKSRKTDGTGDTIVQDADEIGSIRFYGADGTDFEMAASIRGTVDGTPGNNDMPGRLELLTSPDGDRTPVVRWTVEADGDLTSNVTTGGNLQFPKTGTTIAMDSGTAASSCIGTATSNGNTAVTVATTCATTGAHIFISRTSDPTGTGANAQNCWVTNIVNATSFDLDCADADDNGTFEWLIIKEG